MCLNVPFSRSLVGGVEQGDLRDSFSVVRCHLSRRMTVKLVNITSSRTF